MVAQAETVARSFSLPGGASLQLALPALAHEERAEDLPRLDVSGLSGARASLRVGFATEAGLSLRAACVEAPSDGWAPGLEEIVFSLATGIVRRAASEGMRIESLSALAIATRERSFEQALSGSAERSGSSLSLTGKQWLGFEGDAQDAVLCSVLCAEPKASASCNELVAHAELSSLVHPPRPSVLVRSLMLSAEHPLESMGVLSCVVCLGVLVLLRYRPRPRA